MATKRALENSMNCGSYFTAQGYSRTIGYSRGLPPLPRQESQEREITEVWTGNNFERIKRKRQAVIE